MTEENIREMISEIQKLWDRPETFVASRDRERFKFYSDKWKEKKSISEVWRESDAVFFPLFYQDEAIVKARKLLPDHFDAFCDLVGRITTPYVLRDFLMMEMNVDEGWDILLRILENAPITNFGDDLFEDEIKSIVAPVTLDVLVWHILYRRDMLPESLAETRNEVEKEENNMERSADLESDNLSEPPARINQLVGVLKKKGDGFYLAYHYLKYLLWKDLKVDLFYELLDALEKAFHDEANKVLVKDSRIIVEGLDNISASEALVFETTGMLNTPPPNNDVLINYRTTIRLIGLDEQLDNAFNIFKSVYLCNAMSFFTSDMKFQLKHYDIAMLLISQDDVLNSWKEIQALRRAEIHRLSNKCFDELSSDLRYHIKFMWGVNLRMLDYLCRENSELANTMWNEFWKDGLEYFRRFLKFCDNDPYNYLSVLICYYYIYFIKEKTLEGDTSKAAIKGLMPYFHDIDNMPVLVLMASKLLMNNGIKWNDLMKGEDADFFQESFYKALVWTKERKQYEWVGQYLKKKGFVYK